MSIPESQLEIWSHQGSVTQSAETYATIKRALEAPGSAYADKRYQIFLQGSYCNDTNIFSESDVDVVIRLDSEFYHDLAALDEPQKQAFNAVHSAGTYLYDRYKGDVVAQLQKVFGASVNLGGKAITVEPSGNRRRADILATMQYRRYFKFLGLNDQRYDEGICFFTSGGVKVANYPRQHSDNLTAKHQATGSWFKPVVRIAKNLRCRMEDDGLLTKGDTPSYYLEGLLYNVPNDKFGGSYEASLVNSLNWLIGTDRSQFVCANQQYYLLRDDPNFTWSSAKCDAFLNAAVKSWEDW